MRPLRSMERQYLCCPLTIIKTVPANKAKERFVAPFAIRHCNCPTSLRCEKTNCPFVAIKDPFNHCLGSTTFKASGSTCQRSYTKTRLRVQNVFFILSEVEILDDSMNCPLTDVYKEGSFTNEINDMSVNIIALRTLMFFRSSAYPSFYRGKSIAASLCTQNASRQPISKSSLHDDLLHERSKWIAPTTTQTDDWWCIVERRGRKCFQW